VSGTNELGRRSEAASDTTQPAGRYSNGRDPEPDLIGYVLVHGRDAFALLDRGYLTPADFQGAHHRMVWRALERLYMCGMEINSETVALELGYTVPHNNTLLPDVRRLHPYLLVLSRPKPDSYVLAPYEWWWPMIPDDFLDAAEVVAGRT
jgi:hypothetical protein